MLCEPLAMASVFQSLAISEAVRSSATYGARMPYSSPFHQKPFYLKVRDFHSSSHSSSLILFSNGQLSLSVVATADETQQDLISSAQEGAEEISSLSSNTTKSHSLPIRYSHLQELFLQLCGGSDVPSAMDPWLQKLTLSDWNQLLLQCGRQDTDIARKILAFFREKEAVLDQNVLFSARAEALNELTSFQENGDDAAVTSQEITFQEGQDVVTEENLAMEDEAEQTAENISPSLKLYTTFARVLTRKRRYDEVDALEMEVKEAGLEPNVHYCNVLLDSYTQRRTLSKAIDLFHRMKSLGFEPHLYILEQLAFVYADEGNVDVDVLKEITNDLGSRNSTATLTLYKNLMKVHWAANDVARAEEAFEASVAAGYTPEMKEILKLMQLNGRRGNHERVVELVELMVKSGCKPVSSVYDYLIHAYCRSGLMEKARETVLKYDSVLGTRPTLIAINMLIDGYGKQGLYEAAFEMFEAIRQYGYRPTQVSYSSIISAMAKVGKFQSAAKLYDNMLKKGIQPNLHTYSTLIRSYTKCNQTREGHKVFQAMREAPYQMTDTAYSVSLALYVDGNWYHHAAALLKELEDKGVVLDAMAHSSLIRSFSYLQSNTTPLARAVQESETKICKLLTLLFNATSEYKMLDSGIVDAVFSFLEEWKEIGTLEARALVYNAFTDYFYKKGHIDIAKEILHLGRQLYAGYSKPRLLETEWVLDVKGLGVGGAIVALRDWLFGEQEPLEEKGGDDTKMVLITGDEFSLTLPHDDRKVKFAISSLLAELGSPFVESSSSADRLEASLAEVLNWVSAMKISKPLSLYV